MMWRAWLPLGQALFCPPHPPVIVSRGRWRGWLNGHDAGIRACYAENTRLCEHRFCISQKWYLLVAAARSQLTFRTFSKMTEQVIPARLQVIATEVAQLLRERKETISVAETAAGGLISAALLSTPGASKLERWVLDELIIRTWSRWHL